MPHFKLEDGEVAEVAGVVGCEGVAAAVCPPEWNEEIFKKVLAQVENFKRYEYKPYEEGVLMAAEDGEI